MARDDEPKATMPTSTSRHADDELQAQELTDDELEAPWVGRRFYATLASSLKKWIGW
jgi:hypothetical protein